MVKKAGGNELTTAIVATGDTIAAQLLRFNFILDSLKQCPIEAASVASNTLDLDNYLQKQLENMSGYLADVMLIIHLVITIESNEAEAFYRLKKLANHLQDAWTIKLLNKNIIDSLIREKNSITCSIHTLFSRLCNPPEVYKYAK